MASLLAGSRLSAFGSQLAGRLAFSSKSSGRANWRKLLAPPKVFLTALVLLFASIRELAWSQLDSTRLSWTRVDSTRLDRTGPASWPLELELERERL